MRKYFKNDYGEPFEATDSQADIFLTIYTRKFKRNQIIASTQFGKSDTVSMALILRSYTFSENWSIVSGSKDKARIIMTKVIQHIFDHKTFFEKLEIDKDMPLDRLRRERSKDHVTWKGGGGIKVFTANTKNKNSVKEALTGYGSPNIVEDEASLIPNDVQAMILRMLGGHQDNFLLKIGNPFYRNHFYKTWKQSNYNRIFIDYKKALKEGRYTLDFIEEMRNEPFFDVLYECKFPDEDEMLEGGYRRLINEELLDNAFISEEEFQEIYCTKEIILEDGTTVKVPEGHPKLGGDIAGTGDDRSSYVMRWGNVMKLIKVNRISDTMQQVRIIEDLQNDYEILDADIAIDYGGLGQGVGDRLHEKDIFANLVMFGSSAPSDQKAKFKNYRAYIYYEILKWLKNGGKIVKDDSFLELLVINYREDSERKFQIQPKEELKKLMKERNMAVKSPDVADAAALTFADNTDMVGEDDVD